MPQQDSDTTRCSATSQDAPAPSVARKWRVDDTDGELEIVVDQDKYESIATVWVGAAEAHMLAAAPELYAAAREAAIFLAALHPDAIGFEHVLWLLNEACLKAVPQPERVSSGDTSNTDPSPQTTPAAQSAES